MKENSINKEENKAMKNDILFQIDMQLYNEFNDTIATMNDHLGDIYSLRDIEEVEKAEKDKEIKLLREAIKKQQKEIDKLKNKNKDLLRKLRNRVKQVKKLEKYALYKKEFSRLNKELEKKDKIIDLMAEQLAGLKNEVDILEQGNKDCFIPREYSDIDDCVKKESCKECIIEYFIKKVEEQKNGRKSKVDKMDYEYIRYFWNNGSKRKKKYSNTCL